MNLQSVISFERSSKGKKRKNDKSQAITKKKTNSGCGNILSYRQKKKSVDCYLTRRKKIVQV